MSFLIRKMTKEDTKKVQDVAQKSWNTTYEGIIPSEIQENFLNAAYSDEMMEKRLNSSLLLVAEVENSLVGFANYSPVKNECEVELGAIYIYPEHQGKGIGTALLQEGIKILEGVREIYINVEKENKIGKTFYEAKGFKIVQEFDDDFDGHILKTVRMVLEVRS
ncbi:GNAT family N-acetyltransferase [Oceanobacillus damuensis]|uniref:GNAT family N-acetyltransferase n=1 Tax=Oceanobacillus damuensis TaxID=937928 RepID=UPI000A4EFCFD|nr:GNAT family N-acetyltransferase [Oceanobacillus damuensis]